MPRGWQTHLHLLCISSAILLSGRDYHSQSKHCPGQPLASKAVPPAQSPHSVRLITIACGTKCLSISHASFRNSAAGLGHLLGYTVLSPWSTAVRRSGGSGRSRGKNHTRMPVLSRCMAYVPPPLALKSLPNEAGSVALLKRTPQPAWPSSAAQSCPSASLLAHTNQSSGATWAEQEAHPFIQRLSVTLHPGDVCRVAALSP